MIPAIWKKSLLDLWNNKTISLLTILALFVGIVGTGTVLFSYSILNRELGKNYLLTSPPSAILEVNKINPELISKIKRMPGVIDAEYRQIINARALTGVNRFKPVSLYVIPDFNDIRLNKVRLEDKTSAPATTEVLIERAAFIVAKKSIGDSIVISIPGYGRKELRISGSVHAPAEAPAWMEDMIYAYITPETLRCFGYQGGIYQVFISTTGYNPLHNQQIATQIKYNLEKSGVKVSGFKIPQKNHPHADQMRSLLFLLAAFGFITLILSCILVINLINSLIAAHTKQIGIMKALGGSSGQIMAIYLLMVAILAAFSLAAGIPVAIMLSRYYALFTAAVLNFEIYDYTIPHMVFGIIFVIGMIIPLAAAFYPVWKGARTTVLQALSDYGITLPNNVSGHWYVFSEALAKILGRPMVLALRNMIVKWKKQLLTIITIGIGGAVFISALNIEDSIKYTIDRICNTNPSNIQVFLKSPTTRGKIANAMTQVTGISSYDIALDTIGTISGGSSTITRQYRFQGIDPAKGQQLPHMESGRWFRTTEKNAVVISNVMASIEKGVRCGDRISVTFDNQTKMLTVIGIIRQIGPPVAYVDYQDMFGDTPLNNMATEIKIRTVSTKNQPVLESMDRIEDVFAKQNILINSIVNSRDFARILEDHFIVILSFLMMMASLIITVGGLCLSSMMGIMVMERTKEIGILRAIGASGKTITGLILTECVVIALLGFIFSALLSLPLTFHVGNLCSNIFIKTDLYYVLSHKAYAIWMGMIVLVSIISGIFPAYTAAQLKVRDALSYE